MIISIWAVASKWESNGWSLQVVNHFTQSYLRDLYCEDDKAILLKTLEVDKPNDSDLGDMANAMVTEMYGEIAEAQSAVADYKAKFLSLNAPRAEELS